VSIEEVEAEHDAVLWTIGCQSGRPLPVPGGDAPNCVSGVKFLEAFNTGRLQVAADRVVCVGGGDTSIDVVSVTRRLGRINRINPKDRPEMVVHGFVAHDVAVAAARTGTTGRYVDTDYMKCIGCHICADVCPSSYIDMGMGE